MIGYLSSVPHNMYLWTRRVFHWDQNQYSLYSSLSMIAEQLAVLSTALIFRRLTLHDCEIGAASLLALFVKNLAFGFLTTSSQWWVIYVFIIVPSILPTIAIRSQISKLCDGEEIGRYFSLLAILEVLWPLLDTAIFTAVYTSTLSFYPSYQHLVSAGFCVYVLTGFLLLRLSLSSCQRSHTVPDAKRSPAVPDVKGSPTISNVKGLHTVLDVKDLPTVSNVKGSLAVPDVKGSPTVTDVNGSFTVLKVTVYTTPQNTS
nr:uncharacterized protein LOC128698696 [Cherax quadricarinatus]